MDYIKLGGEGYLLAMIQFMDLDKGLLRLGGFCLSCVVYKSHILESVFQRGRLSSHCVGDCNESTPPVWDTSGCS